MGQRKFKYPLLGALLLAAVPAMAGVYVKVTNGEVVNLPVTGGATLNSNISCSFSATSARGLAGERAVMVTQVTVKNGATASTFGVVPSDTGLTDPELFNSGTALTAGAKYTFTWFAKPGVTYDWYWGTTTTVSSQLTVEEGR